jgi:dihydroorotase-like cyclic amidohydrolase
VTTLVDMPLNSVPTTTTAQLLQDKIAAVKVSATQPLLRSME